MKIFLSEHNLELKKNKIYFTISSFVYPKFSINSVEKLPLDILEKLTKSKASLKILNKVT